LTYMEAPTPVANKTVAVYAGSFDPPTSGHMYMVKQGAKLFGRMIVAVGTNPDKTYTFTTEERVAMLTECTPDFDNVSVDSFENLFLVDYAESVGAQFILRGIRSEADYQFERAMRNVNEDLKPDITTVFLMPPREICEVSSSFVKGLVGPKGWREVIKPYVPDPVYQKLMEKDIQWHTQTGGVETVSD